MCDNATDDQCRAVAEALGRGSGEDCDKLYVELLEICALVSLGLILALMWSEARYVGVRPETARVSSHDPTPSTNRLIYIPITL